MATLLNQPRAWGRPERGARATASEWRTTAHAVADVITWSLQTDSPHGARAAPSRMLTFEIAFSDSRGGAISV